MTKGFFRSFSVALICATCFGATSAFAESCPSQATMNGKYHSCVDRIPCSKDSYATNPYDYGLYGPVVDYCGEAAPRGYWVFYNKVWYIFKCNQYGCVN